MIFLTGAYHQDMILLSHMAVVFQNVRKCHTVSNIGYSNILPQESLIGVIMVFPFLSFFWPIDNILTGVRYFINVILICISLVDNNLNKFLIHQKAISISIFNCLFMHFDHFLTEIVCDVEFFSVYHVFLLLILCQISRFLSSCKRLIYFCCKDKF